MDMTKYKLTVTFNTPVLGSQPGQDTPASDYVREKAAELLGQELPLDEQVPVLEKGTTGFYRLPGTEDPCIMDYQVKGFLKEAGLTFNGLRGVKSLRSKIAAYVFVGPRHIALEPPPATELAYNERPLRAMTMQGPRVSLARSEELPEGTRFTCTITVLDQGPITEAVLRDLLDYGQFQGFGQWRSGGHGSFTYELEKL